MSRRDGGPVSRTQNTPRRTPPQRTSPSRFSVLRLLASWPPQTPHAAHPVAFTL